MSERVVRGENLRSDVTVVEETPDLDALGRAGARLKLDQMLLAHHGHTEQEWQQLTREERQLLREMAREEDPTWGLSHQVDAIGALARLRDEGALLEMAELARDGRGDLRVQIAATHALGEIGGDGVRSVLRQLLTTRRPEVRAQAAKSLARAGTAADVAALEAASERDESFARDIARQAAAALRTRMRVS